MVKQKNMGVWKKLALWAGIFLVAILVISGLVSRVSDKPQDGPSGESVRDITDQDQVRGNPLSQISLIEYSDFQCPACAAYHPILQKLNEEYGNRIKFVYRHFPLTKIHKNAERAAWAAESAGKQGKFFEYHDILFEKQSEWSESKDVEGEFKKFAESLKLDTVRFETDIKSDSVRDKVVSDSREAQRAGLPGTPSFFLNGKKIDNPQSYDDFKRIIDEKLQLAQ